MNLYRLPDKRVVLVREFSDPLITYTLYNGRVVEAVRVEWGMTDRHLRMERMGSLVRDCPGCAERWAAADPTSVMGPSHEASRHCESGGRPHCSCDACF